MNPLLSALAITIPAGCTSNDAVPTTALQNSNAVCQQVPQVSLPVLVIVDGSTDIRPDLNKIGPIYMEQMYSTTDPDACKSVTSWPEFDALLACYSHIGILVVILHGNGTNITLGNHNRTLTEIATVLSKTGMPTIDSIALDGCAAGFDVNGLLYLATTRNLQSLTAYPYLVGYAGYENITWPQNELSSILARDGSYILGPKTATDVIQKNILIYSCLYTESVNMDDFPGADIPDPIVDSTGYRTDLGFFQRGNAKAYTIPKTVAPNSNDALAREVFLMDAYAKLRAYVPGSNYNPYDFLYQVVVT